MNSNIKSWRNKIDKIDSKIISLLRQRLGVAKKIGKYKKKNGLPIKDLKRERELLQKVAEKAKKRGLEDIKEIKLIFNSIMSYSRKTQKKV